MKTILIKLIKIYQSTPTSLHKACRFYPTCSNYAIEALETHGTIKGIWLTIKRLCKCTPWYKGSCIDFVPKKEKK